MVPMVAPPDPGEDTPPDRDEDTPRVHRPLSQLRDCWCFTPSLLFFFRWKWGLVKVFMAASRPTLDIFLLRDTGLASLTTSCPGLTSISTVTLSLFSLPEFWEWSNLTPSLGDGCQCGDTVADIEIRIVRILGYTQLLSLFVLLQNWKLFLFVSCSISSAGLHLAFACNQFTFVSVTNTEHRAAQPPPLSSLSC